MSVRVCVAVAAVASALFTGCGTPVEPEDPGRKQEGDRMSEGALPSGWRWESYRDVEVGVPAEWGHDNSSQRVHQWCTYSRPPEPAVGRPGVMTLVGCFGGSGQVPHPSTLVDTLGTFVGFDYPERGATSERATEGDRTTVTVGEVRVLVQAEPSLRQRIVSTIRRVSTNAHGCPVADPISNDPGRRPEPAIDVNKLSGVHAVSACKYTLRDGFSDTDLTGPTLMSSLRLEGADARRAIAAVAAAPVGGGPNRPGECMRAVSYGDEAVVLRIMSDQGQWQIYLRYSGCDHNGLDDGVNVRALTRDAVAPFLTGANTITNGFSGGDQKAAILYPATG